MKFLFAAGTLIDQAGIEFLKNLLDSEHIRYIVRNEYLSMAAGEIPPQAGQLQIWILDDSDYARATEFVEAWRSLPSPCKISWQCPTCGENHEGQFTACWKCGYDREIMERVST